MRFFLLVVTVFAISLAVLITEAKTSEEDRSKAKQDDDCRWSRWGRWGGCSKTCGTGTMTRVRMCRCDDKRKRDNDDNSCYGSRSQTKPCNTQSCRQYVSVGCYKDAHDRALPCFAAKYHDITTAEKISACACLAKQLHVTYFGMQDGGECWVDRKGRNQYGKHGKSSNCRNGIGDKWTNHVYRMV